MKFQISSVFQKLSTLLRPKSIVASPGGGYQFCLGPFEPEEVLDGNMANFWLPPPSQKFIEFLHSYKLMTASEQIEVLTSIHNRCKARYGDSNIKPVRLSGWASVYENKFPGLSEMVSLLEWDYFRQFHISENTLQLG
jgi:hypothetical protein